MAQAFGFIMMMRDTRDASREHCVGPTSPEQQMSSLLGIKHTLRSQAIFGRVRLLIMPLGCGISECTSLDTACRAVRRCCSYYFPLLGNSRSVSIAESPMQSRPSSASLWFPNRPSITICESVGRGTVSHQLFWFISPKAHSSYWIYAKSRSFWSPGTIRVTAIRLPSRHTPMVSVVYK